MLTRVVSGVLMALAIIGVLIYTPWWAMGLVVLGAMFLGASELQKMARPDADAVDRGAFKLACLAVVLWPIIGLPVEGNAPLWPTYQHGPALLVGFSILFMTRLFRPDPIETSMRRLADDSVGLLYIGLTFPYVFLLRWYPPGGWVLLMVMVITFLGDTGAYFAGRLFGKHKMYEKISPKKTMEGAAGGILAAIGGAFFCRAFFPGFEVLTPLDCVVLGGVGAVVGILGDLAESMMKRAYGVKDSGSLIPGHGGALDRIDALLFVGPFAWFYLETFDKW